MPSSGNNPVISLNREEQLKSEIEILKSPSIAEEVVKALGPEYLYADLGVQGQGFLSSQAPAGVGARLSPVQAAVLKFEKNLKVESVKKSNVIRISYKNKDPRVAAAAVNVLAIRYLNRPLGVNRNPESDNFFEEQSRVLEDKLIRADNNYLVLSFMAAWCGPCIDELPALNRPHKKYEDSHVQIIGISIDFDGPDAMQPIIKKLKIEFPVFWCGEKAISKFDLHAIPMLLFIRQGEMVERLHGNRPEKLLDQKIREFIKK